MTLLIKHGTVFYENKLSLLDILIRDDKIIEVGKHLNVKANQTIDAKGLTILPGLIDIHTHLREPGFEYKETIATGTKAAARGGFTTICCMPNLDPVPDSLLHLKKLQDAITHSAIVNVLPYASITINELGAQIVNMKQLAKYVFAFSDDGRGVQSANIMKEAMINAKKLNKCIVAHCEDRKLSNGGVINECIYARKHNLLPINNASEYEPIQRDIELVKKTKVHYHVCHISTKESLDIIEQAKRKKLPVSCEVTPHHLLLNDTMLQDLGSFKMAPPLRSPQDQKALQKCIKNGVIDLIVTDHAPHASREKNKGLKGSAFGIVGLETSFPLMYTHLVKSKLISLKRLVELMSLNASQLFRLPYGPIQPNAIANLSIFNLGKKFKISSRTFKSKGKSTPFNGYECYGVIKYTIVNGKIVYRG
jgi:dihydroorotase